MTGSQFDALYSAIVELSSKVGGIGASVELVSERLGRVDSKVDSVVSRVNNLEASNQIRQGATEEALRVHNRWSGRMSLVIAAVGSLGLLIGGVVGAIGALGHP